MQLTLDSTQSEVLHEILENALIELRLESARADSHDYREQLHRREQTVESVLDQLASLDRPERPAF